MNYVAVFVATFLPLLAVSVPGFAITRVDRSQVLDRIVRSILWSVSVLTILSFLAALFHVSSVWVVLVAIGLGVIITLVTRHTQPPLQRHHWIVTGGILVLYVLFGIVFWQQHQGLPTGDSQKAIIWASHINNQQQLPNYTLAAALFNRDPVDFYTPGLHTLTALLTRWSPLPYTTIGLFAIIIGISVALLAGTTIRTLLPHASPMYALLGIWLVLTNVRFLRYLREPGYHFQNVYGELLLFGIVFLALHLLKQWRWLDSLLIIFLALSLLLSHQFSAFIAFFICLPIGACLIFKYATHPDLRRYVTTPRLLVIGLLLAAGIAAGFALGLHHKLPHIFTFNAHLRSLTPPLTNYPRTLGALWVYGGLAGLALMLIKNQRAMRLLLISFFASTVVLFLLSQGPHFGIDIPPVRALFYAVWPLSVAAVYFIHSLREAFAATSKQTARLTTLVIVAVVGLTGISALGQALPSQHAVRTNSTLLPHYLPLITKLGNDPQAGHILTDDYNRRSSSWLILTGHGMYTRIAADLRTQMAESSQSPLRRELYLRQLDFEKIFSLGSLPDIEPLLASTATRWLTGIDGSSATAFAHNPLLHAVESAGDLTLFERSVATPLATFDQKTQHWLLKHSTLANDIGDEEDTFEHLPASLHATRLSAPLSNGTTTWRTTTAPLVPLRFNVRDYVQPLLNSNRLHSSESAFAVLLRFVTLPPSLTLHTATGFTLPVSAQNTLLHIPANHITFDDDGFVTVWLVNEQQGLVGIDVIALGLAQVP